MAPLAVAISAPQPQPTHSFAKRFYYGSTVGGIIAGIFVFLMIMCFIYQFRRRRALTYVATHDTSAAAHANATTSGNQTNVYVVSPGGQPPAPGQVPLYNMNPPYGQPYPQQPPPQGMPYGPSTTPAPGQQPAYGFVPPQSPPPPAQTYFPPSQPTPHYPYPQQDGISSYPAASGPPPSYKDQAKAYMYLFPTFVAGVVTGIEN
ncbi:hypothetical protein FQN57_001478 [Myotisia sp. PD_48]|nr:hypothetical protein FQN57_001478 [Myotisia sp. PD_48]